MRFDIYGVPWQRWIRMSYEERCRAAPEWAAQPVRIWWLQEGAGREKDEMNTQIEVAQETTKALGARREIGDLVVETADDVALAGAFLVEAKSEWKRLDERRKEITAPMNEALRSANDLFRPALTAYAEAEGILKRKIVEAQQAIDRGNRAAMEAAQAALAAGNVRAAAEASHAIAPIPQAAGVTTRAVWEFRVIDAALVPREFLVIDEKLIRAHVQAHGDSRPIPGVLVERGTQVSARTR